MMPRRALATVLFALLAAGGARAQPLSNPSFNLVNRSAAAIQELYASPAGATRWGQDRLGETYLPPGGSFPVRLPADGSCVYDVRVVYADGKAEERRGLNTCAVESVTFPAGKGAAPARPAREASLRLVNRGRAVVQEVYATPPGNPNWGSDWLGEDTVEPGATHVIRLPGAGCLYDVRVVYADGKAEERRRVDLCAAPDFRLP